MIKFKDILKEEIEDFEVGDEKNIDGSRHKITNIDPTTKSVSWSIKKGLTDYDIHRELSKLIDKLDDGKRDYYDLKRLKSLITKLKFIRNTFKRTSN